MALWCHRKRKIISILSSESYGMMSKTIPSTKVEVDHSTVAPGPALESNISSLSQQPDVEQKSVDVPAARIAPDGGVLAWSVVLGAWCTSFCSFGWLNSMSHASLCLTSFILTANRHWRLSRVLSERSTQSPLPKHYRLDYQPADLLHDGNWTNCRHSV